MFSCTFEGFSPTWESQVTREKQRRVNKQPAAFPPPPSLQSRGLAGLNAEPGRAEAAAERRGLFQLPIVVRGCGRNPGESETGCAAARGKSPSEVVGVELTFHHGQGFIIYRPTCAGRAAETARGAQLLLGAGRLFLFL